jgi:hypothetical protein
MCTSLRFLRKKRSRRRKNRPGSYDPSNPHPIFNNSASYDISGSLLNYGIANSGYLYTETGSSVFRYYISSNSTSLAYVFPSLTRAPSKIHFTVDELPSMLRDLWLNRSKLPLAQLVACLFVYFVITIAFTVWETLGPVLTLEQLKWNVLHNCLLYVGMGITAGVTLAILKGLTKVHILRFSPLGHSRFPLLPSQHLPPLSSVVY